MTPSRSSKFMFT